MALLREALASVAAQTWQDFELVLADNSADPEIQRSIDGLLAEFPTISFGLTRHPKQIDAISNFNSLIDAAKGEFLIFLGDDDRICRDSLRRSVEALDRHQECAFTFGDHWIMRADGSLDEPATLENSKAYGRNGLREGVYPNDQLFDLALRQSMCLQTALFRRAAIQPLKFLPDIMCGDLSMFLRLSASAARFQAYYLDERIFEYRVHDSQISNTTDKQTLLRAQIAAFETVTNVPLRHRTRLAKKVGRCHLALAFLEAEQGRSQNARAHAMKSLRSHISLSAVAGGLVVLAAPSAIHTVRALRDIWRTAE